MASKVEMVWNSQLFCDRGCFEYLASRLASMFNRSWAETAEWPQFEYCISELCSLTVMLDHMLTRPSKHTSWWLSNLNAWSQLFLYYSLLPIERNVIGVLQYHQWHHPQISQFNRETSPNQPVRQHLHAFNRPLRTFSFNPMPCHAWSRNWKYSTWLEMPKGHILHPHFYKHNGEFLKTGSFWSSWGEICRFWEHTDERQLEQKFGTQQHPLDVSRGKDRRSRPNGKEENSHIDVAGQKHYQHLESTLKTFRDDSNRLYHASKVRVFEYEDEEPGILGATVLGPASFWRLELPDHWWPYNPQMVSQIEMKLLLSNTPVSWWLWYLLPWGVLTN